MSIRVHPRLNLKSKMIDIKVRLSRHAKRRMRLYDILESDVVRAIKQGEKVDTDDNKTAFLLSMPLKYKYPLKVVTIHQDDRILVVTAYPLKNGRME